MEAFGTTLAMKVHILHNSSKRQQQQLNKTIQNKQKNKIKQNKQKYKTKQNNKQQQAFPFFKACTFTFFDKLDKQNKQYKFTVNHIFKMAQTLATLICYSHILLFLKLQFEVTHMKGQPKRHSMYISWHSLQTLDE